MQKLFPGIATVSLAYAFEIQTWLASVRGSSQRWSFRELLPLLQIEASTLDGESHEITGRIICSLTLQAKLESKCGQGKILFKDTRIYPISFRALKLKKILDIRTGLLFLYKPMATATMLIKVIRNNINVNRVKLSCEKRGDTGRRNLLILQMLILSYQDYIINLELVERSEMGRKSS
ncbi:hypothetical protein PVK06_025975 [Gossypium arboreum]|uniref:Uncharacterized protein n=1 Tax=Gossypium arboreum TaxID=29729 RepID=A0ABR0NXJ8_GOSAR|nr:hypothetical protein PVK06_025975 [Gossypium arboreum]